MKSAEKKLIFEKEECRIKQIIREYSFTKFIYRNVLFLHKFFSNVIIRNSFQENRKKKSILSGKWFCFGSKKLFKIFKSFLKKIKNSKQKQQITHFDFNKMLFLTQLSKKMLFQCFPHFVPRILEIFQNMRNRFLENFQKIERKEFSYRLKISL